MVLQYSFSKWHCVCTTVSFFFCKTFQLLFCKGVVTSMETHPIKLFSDMRMACKAQKPRNKTIPTHINTDFDRSNVLCRHLYGSLGWLIYLLWHVSFGSIWFICPLGPPGGGLCSLEGGTPRWAEDLCGNSGLQAFWVRKKIHFWRMDSLQTGGTVQLWNNKQKHWESQLHNLDTNMQSNILMFFQGMYFFQSFMYRWFSFEAHGQRCDRTASGQGANEGVL